MAPSPDNDDRPEEPGQIPWWIRWSGPAGLLIAQIMTAVTLRRAGLAYHLPNMENPTRSMSFVSAALCIPVAAFLFTIGWLNVGRDWGNVFALWMNTGLMVGLGMWIAIRGLRYPDSVEIDTKRHRAKVLSVIIGASAAVTLALIFFLRTT